LQIVSEASPEQLHLHFRQAPHMKLPQAQFTFDPGVTKFCHLAAEAVLRSSLLAGHLLPERQHRRAFCHPRYRTASLLILRTALRLARAALAVPPFRFITVICEAFPLGVPAVVTQQLAFRTNVNVSLLRRLLLESRIAYVASWQVDWRLSHPFGFDRGQRECSIPALHWSFLLHAPILDLRQNEPNNR
jgi:hypothetical protein